MKTSKKVYQTLKRADLISSSRAKMIWGRCRDREIKVFEDAQTGVIYLDPIHAGNPVDYYSSKHVNSIRAPRNDIEWQDTKRRSTLLEPVIANKRWLDFGCGPGQQLRASHPIASSCLGFDLNTENLKALTADGFETTSSFERVERFNPQATSLFHVLEHLDDPVSVLSSLHETSTPEAKLIVEVPHARDWLIHNGPDAFKEFTFWSEHLVLHTRTSLSHILEKSGWVVDYVYGVQRYPVWNHFAWFQRESPTGLSQGPMGEPGHQLADAYQAYLAARDETDTLIAMAHKT